MKSNIADYILFVHEGVEGDRDGPSVAIIHVHNCRTCIK
jgi:hypothetical protein